MAILEPHRDPTWTVASYRRHLAGYLRQLAERAENPAVSARTLGDSLGRLAEAYRRLVHG